jgi:large subunit ribosomal protein L18
MENSTVKVARAKQRRALRVRKHVRGNIQKPRMCVVKSNKHIQVQLINDDAGHTLASVSTRSKELTGTNNCKKNKESARVLGTKIAEKAKALGINQVIFDRGPFKYHGILAALADSARESGLEF